jgi:hypothetical protein
MLAGIEEGKVTGNDFGLQEICRLSNGMGVTPYRLILKWGQLVKDAGEPWWQPWANGKPNSISASGRSYAENEVRVNESAENSAT